MRLTLQSQLTGDVVVIRCRGRIVAGEEADALEAELERQTKIPGTIIVVSKKVVLQMAETDFIDSSGLGSLVRMLSVLRASGGDLRFCDVSPFVLRVLQITNLTSIFRTYASEKEAIESFAGTWQSAPAAHGTSKVRIVCVDTSADLLAYVNAVLKRAGHEVFTTRYPNEALTLVNVTMPGVVICGPGMMRMATGESSVEKLRHSGHGIRVLVLPSDFSTADAGEAGLDLVAQVNALIGL
jgi:anti-anti-sigma factor